MVGAVGRSMSAGDWALIVLLSLLWGGSFFFVEIAVAHFPPLTLVCLRLAGAALCLWAFVLVTARAKGLTLQSWLALAAMGFLNNLIPFSLIVWGQTVIASGLAAILNATTPLFTVLVAGALLPDERMTLTKIAGVLAGLAGVAVMVGPAARGGLGQDALAQLAILGAAASYALAGVYGRRFRRMRLEPTVTAAGQVAASAVMLLPVALAFEGARIAALPPVPAHVWAAVVALAILSTALAYVIYFRVLASAGATNLLLVTFLVPVSAVWLGVAILGERLEPHQIAGMALIALGLSGIDGRLWRRR